MHKSCRAVSLTLLTRAGEHHVWRVHQTFMERKPMLNRMKNIVGPALPRHARRLQFHGRKARKDQKSLENYLEAKRQFPPFTCPRTTCWRFWGRRRTPERAVPFEVFERVRAGACAGGSEGRRTVSLCLSSHLTGTCHDLPFGQTIKFHPTEIFHTSDKGLFSTCSLPKR
jgi:hypothetical protein